MPQHKPGQSHPVQSEQLRARIAAGKINVRPGIERFDVDGVVFLDPTLVVAENNDLPLWKRTVHPELPGLFFICLAQPVGAMMPVAEAQFAWWPRCWAASMPCRRQMAANQERNKKQSYASPSHTMEVDVDHDLWDFRREWDWQEGASAAGTCRRKGGHRGCEARRPGDAGTRLRSHHHHGLRIIDTDSSR